MLVKYIVFCNCFEEQSNLNYFIPDYKRSVWSPKDNAMNDVLTKYENSFVNGFQIATVAGPLCEEPMTGVCFVVEDWTIDVSQQISS